MALNNCLYVVGGWDGQGVVKSVEMFNPTKGVWQEVSTHPNIRMKSGVAALDGKIYVVSFVLLKTGFYLPLQVGGCLQTLESCYRAEVAWPLCAQVPNNLFYFTFNILYRSNCCIVLFRGPA